MSFFNFTYYFVKKKKPTIPTFPTNPTIYNQKENYMETNYKRKTREVPQSVRDRISAALRGRKKSEAQCKKISNSLKKSWSRIPRQNTGQSGTTIEDIMW